VRRFEIDEGPNSLCLGAIVYATGGSATWSVILDIDFCVPAVIVRSTDTFCCCLECLFVRFWLPFVVLEVRLILVDELDSL
jgi:hypothetical protein